LNRYIFQPRFANQWSYNIFSKISKAHVKNPLKTGQTSSQKLTLCTVYLLYIQGGKSDVISCMVRTSKHTQTHFWRTTFPRLAEVLIHWGTPKFSAYLDNSSTNKYKSSISGKSMSVLQLQLQLRIITFCRSY
jgi:hypothetical protein